MDLPRALFGVLSARTHVEGWATARVVPKEELFAGDGFGFDVLWGDERVEPEIAPPFEGAFEALDGLGHVVFRGAYVAQDALVGLGGTGRVRGVGREKEKGDERATCAPGPSTRPFLCRRRGGHSLGWQSGRARGRTLPCLARWAVRRWDGLGRGVASALEANNER